MRKVCVKKKVGWDGNVGGHITKNKTSICLLYIIILTPQGINEAKSHTALEEMVLRQMSWPLHDYERGL